MGSNRIKSPDVALTVAHSAPLPAHHWLLDSSARLPLQGACSWLPPRSDSNHSGTRLGD